MRFREAGFKFGHMWISLENYREGRSINQDVTYAIFVDRRAPVLGPSRVEERDMRRFPVIEFEVDLEGLPHDFKRVSKIDEFALVIFVSDANTRKDGQFVKEVLGFTIEKGAQSASAARGVPRSLDKIPLYYEYEGKAIFPILGRSSPRGYLTEDFFVLTQRPAAGSRAVLNSLDQVRARLTPDARRRIVSLLGPYQARRESERQLEVELKSFQRTMSKEKKY